MTQKNPWQGKVAIVSGGSSGIGKATALALVERGARVVISGRNESNLAEVAKGHAAIEIAPVDSADPTSGETLVDAALRHGGRLDLIVNNAGAGHPLPIDGYEAEPIATMCAVNIIGPSMLVKAGRQALRESQGAIVNVGTAVSRNAAPSLAHYAATKLALEHLTRSWAIELAGDRIRVNGVSPGPVKSGALTGMMGLSPEVAEQIEAQEAAQIPLGRRGTTDDIVPWILRLASADNGWTTGQVLTIDGGWSQR